MKQILTIRELQDIFEARSSSLITKEAIKRKCHECDIPQEEKDFSVESNGIYCVPCVELKRLLEIENICRLSGIPVMYRNASLHEDHRSLFLTGGNGVGKTFKAAGVVRYWIGKLSYTMITNLHNTGNYPIFITVPELLMKIRNCFSLSQYEEAIVAKYSTCPILVLDDIGVEKTTDWALQTLYIILNNRYSNYMQTIITSNLTLEEVKEKLGERIASRIAGMCKIIQLKGKDRRITVK